MTWQAGPLMQGGADEHPQLPSAVPAAAAAIQWFVKLIEMGSGAPASFAALHDVNHALPVWTCMLCLPTSYACTTLMLHVHDSFWSTP
jgi:hypothetical protein